MNTISKVSLHKTLNSQFEKLYDSTFYTLAKLLFAIPGFGPAGSQVTLKDQITFTYAAMLIHIAGFEYIEVDGELELVAFTVTGPHNGYMTLDLANLDIPTMLKVVDQLERESYHVHHPQQAA